MDNYAFADLSRRMEMLEAQLKTIIDQWEASSGGAGMPIPIVQGGAIAGAADRMAEGDLVIWEP